MGGEGGDVGEEGRGDDAGENVVRYAGLEGAAAGRGDGGLEWELGWDARKRRTNPKVVPWSPILMMSATLSFMRIAPMGTPCEGTQCGLAGLAE